MIHAFFALVPVLAFAGDLNLEKFQERVKKHVDSLSGKTTVSVQIELLGKGTELFSHNGKNAIIPASNTKLITALAALEKMKAGYSYSTRVYRKGNDLILMGNGDPYLVSERLYLLARDVARSGIKNVQSIRVNNSAFKENYKGLMDWDESGEPFTAMVSPTSANFNSLEVHIRSEGGKSRAELGPVPHGYAKLQNEVTLVPGSKKNIAVKPLRVDGDKEVFVVRGTLGKDASSAIVYGSVTQPESYIAHLFAALLRQEGVTVTKDFGGSTFGPLDSGAVEVAEQSSQPLIDMLRLLNTYSNNFMTEQLFQSMGAVALGGPASTEKSRQVISEFLRQRDACKDAYVENGSGLSWNTRISAKCFTETLQWSYRDFRFFADLIGSLPIGGQTGTLRSRFKRAGGDFEPHKVRAKTGTLWSKQVVTSLVGITQTGDGQPVLFALIENDQRNDPGQLSVLKDWEDKCVEFIQQLQL